MQRGMSVQVPSAWRLGNKVGMGGLAAHLALRHIVAAPGTHYCASVAHIGLTAVAGKTCWRLSHGEASRIIVFSVLISSAI